MRIRVLVGPIVRSIKRFVILSLFGVVTLSDRPLCGQTTNSTSTSTNVQPYWFRTNSPSATVGKVALRKGPSANLAGSGAHYRMWTVTDTNSAANEFRQPTPRSASGGTCVMEVGSGMNYWDGERWTASDPSLEVSPEGDAFVANRLCYKVRLQADNLNTLGAITITTPDGKVLRSTPIAIGLYDAASGQTMILAGITNCAGVLVSSNKVLYQDAFNANGVRASVVCTAERGSFAADVVLTSRFDPADYGFPTNTTRIEMITEYYEPPQPDRIRTAIRVETDPAVRQKMATPDLIDETLGFGELAFGQGRAYTMTNGSPDASSAVAGASIPASRGGAVVAKEFLSTDGRTFLVESIEYPSIQKALQTLPKRKSNGAFLKPKRSRRAEFASIPAAEKENPAAKKRNRAELASITTMRITGFCIDPYQYIDSGTISTAKVFQGDVTYFIAGPVYCNGPVTIEGGAVFKYPNSTGANASTAFLQLNNTLTCKTAQYRPAVFTAGDDDAIGTPMGHDDPFSRIWANWTGSIAGKYYANPAIVTGNALALSNCRFLYANVAIACSGMNYASVTVEHSQFISCIQGISVVDYGNGSGGGSSGSGLRVTLNNCLMTGVNYPLQFLNDPDAPSSLSAWFTHCTINNATRLKASGSGCYVGIFATNSIFANVAGLSYDGGCTSITGDYNGFYNTPLIFGAHHPASPGTSPFQSSGGGNYYLKDSNFRNAGTAAIPPPLLNSLKTRTTQPPINFPRSMELRGELTLFPQIPRYVSGPPDLGYHYDALDYTVAAMKVEGGKITVLPGTAVGVRMEFIDVDIYTFYGFQLEQGSSFISQGTPAKPNTFTDVQLVQESASWPVLAAFVLHYVANAEKLPPPTLNFRFSNFSLGGGGPLVNQISFHFISGLTGRGNLLSPNSAAFVDMRDCNVYGGQLEFGKAWAGQGPAAVTWFNNVFDRVAISIDPNWPDFNDPTIYVNMAFQAYNNTFHEGFWFHLEPITLNDGTHWTLKDNLFDKVDFVQDTDQALDYDYNAYWPLTQGELDVLYQLYPWAPLNFAELQITTPGGDLNGGDERGLTIAPPYQTGPLGNFYLPTSSELYNSMKRGSRSVADAGLYHFTTRTDQLKDGAQSGNVIIGHHYVATLNSSSTSPKDSETPTPDGIPDYVEDANGNGSWDSDTETKIDTAYTVTGIHDSLNAIYDDVDLDGDGMVGRIEKALNKSPLVFDNPLVLGNPTTVDSPHVLGFELPINYTFLTSIGDLSLNIDGADATIEDCIAAGNGNSLVVWNSSFDAPGLRFVQPQLSINSGGKITAITSAMGPITPFLSDNVLQFFEAGSMYDDSGAYLDAQLPVPNATYTITLYDPSTIPATPIKTIGPKPTYSGTIMEDWSPLTDSNGNPYTGDSVEAVFTVTLLDSGGSPTANGTGIKFLTRPTGALSEWSPRINFIYMYTPTNDAYLNEFAKGGTVWDAMQSTVNVLIDPIWTWPVYESYFDTYPPTLNPNAGYISQRSIIELTLLPLLSDARQFYCLSHGSPTMLSNADGDVYMKAGEVANLLGNRHYLFRGMQTSNPYRFVFLDACSTARKKTWARAFGVVPMQASSQATRNKVGPQAFVGWSREVSDWLGIDSNSGRPLQVEVELARRYSSDTLGNFYSDWMGGATLAACIDFASDASIFDCPFPVEKNKVVTVEVSGTPYTIPLYTAKIYVVGHSGLTVSTLVPTDDNYFKPPYQH